MNDAEAFSRWGRASDELSVQRDCSVAATGRFFSSRNQRFYRNCWQAVFSRVVLAPKVFSFTGSFLSTFPNRTTLSDDGDDKCHATVNQDDKHRMPIPTPTHKASSGGSPVFDSIDNFPANTF